MLPAGTSLHSGNARKCVGEEGVGLCVGVSVRRHGGCKDEIPLVNPAKHSVLEKIRH
jgi:hypothetical protein